MGYYSSLETDARINKDKLEELKKEIEKEIEKETEMSCFWLQDDFIILEPNNEGIIYLDFVEWNTKHYNDEEFISFIQPYLDYSTNKFYDFKFVSEDSERWGYRVYPDKINVLSCEWIEEEE